LTREIFKYIFLIFLRESVQGSFHIDVLKNSFGFSHTILSSIELMANLPTGEQFPNGIDISLKTIGFQSSNDIYLQVGVVGNILPHSHKMK
jgi:hypothetical protein